MKFRLRQAQSRPRESTVTPDVKIAPEAVSDVTMPSQRAWADEGLLGQLTYTGWRRRARLMARWGLLTAGRPTYRMRMLPSFLIVGAERCATAVR